MFGAVLSYIRESMEVFGVDLLDRKVCMMFPLKCRITVVVLSHTQSYSDMTRNKKNLLTFHRKRVNITTTICVSSEPTGFQWCR